MDMASACRCCLAEGIHKDLKSPYVYMDKKEVYSEMLLECFNIFLMPSELSGNTICEECIKNLRSSWYFKQQVLRAEDNLLQKKLSLTTVTECKPELEVKQEPKYDSDDSDDYFLADTVREPSMEHIKAETEKKTDSKAKRKKSEDWKTGGIKSLVTRLSKATSITISRNTSSSVSKRSKTRTITIPKEKPKIIWNSTFQPKHKYIDNLQTILKYSNVTPFKNKSLLGFICAYCTIAYPDPANLRNHVQTEHKKERLNLKTKDMSHFNVNLDITNLTCTLCDEKIEDLNGLKLHLVDVHKKVIHNDVKDLLFQFKLKPGESYDCAMCTNTYETFKMLKQHMNVHYSNFQCNKCDSGFATKRSLASHKTTHQDGSYKCDRCDKVFPTISKKHYHVKTKHLGTRNISNCPFCDEPFRSYYQRNQHLIKVHNTEAQYKCNVCSRSFLLKSLLMNHIKKNHLMERNAQCTECGYRFFSKKALKAHMVKHTGERNYACEVCHKTYARKFTLREHMRIHNNDRRFKCDICGMTFVQKCSLRSHLLSNHGISMAASEISSQDSA